MDWILSNIPKMSTHQQNINLNIPWHVHMDYLHNWKNQIDAFKMGLNGKETTQQIGIHSYNRSLE